MAQSTGEKASYFVNAFRILIDDKSETRFTDLDITDLLNIAEQDVINDLRIMGWDFGLRKTENVTILADTQEISLSVNATANTIFNVRRNETNNTSIVPVVTKEAALISQYPVVYFHHPEGSGGSINPVLGYYIKVTTASKFTVEFMVNFIGDLTQTIYQANTTTDQMPAVYSNLLLYKALALASTADTNRVGIFDARYERSIDTARQIVGTRPTQVVDVYNDYGSN